VIPGHLFPSRRDPLIDPRSTERYGRTVARSVHVTVRLIDFPSALEMEGPRRAKKADSDLDVEAKPRRRTASLPTKVSIRVRVRVSVSRVLVDESALKSPLKERRIQKES